MLGGEMSSRDLAVELDSAGIAAVEILGHSKSIRMEVRDMRVLSGFGSRKEKKGHWSEFLAKKRDVTYT